MFTGVQNISRIHLVDKWNGLSKVRGERRGPLERGGCAGPWLLGNGRDHRASSSFVMKRVLGG